MAAPPEPARVDPFFSPADLVALNDFTTRYLSDLGALDFSLDQQRIDTTFQKTQTASAAKQASSNTQDEMIARGLFRSSIKDAALYDIEAQRALSSKFLDDKMAAATLNAGTQKQVMADGKKRFDEAMLARKVENAQSVNDAAAAAWADAVASYNAANPAPAQAPAPAPAAPLSVSPQQKAAEAAFKATQAQAEQAHKALLQKAKGIAPTRKQNTASGYGSLKKPKARKP